jgi:hypothetical protein
MKYVGGLGVVLAIPHDERTVVVTRHELFAIVEPTDRAHDLSCAVKVSLGFFQLQIPQNNETTVESDEDFDRVQRVIAQMHDLARLCLLRELDGVVPLDVIARLGKVIVDIKQIGVALVRAHVQPVAFKWQANTRCSIRRQQQLEQIRFFFY